MYIKICHPSKNSNTQHEEKENKNTQTKGDCTQPKPEKNTREVYV